MGNVVIYMIAAIQACDQLRIQVSVLHPARQFGGLGVGPRYLCAVPGRRGSAPVSIDLLTAIAHAANVGLSHGALRQAIVLAGEARCQVELPLEISGALSNLVHTFEVPMTLAGGVENFHQVLQQEHAVGKHVDSGTVDRDRINTM
jgi:hypothetical protein